MARAEARIRTVIWDDADYTTRLTRDGQWMYEFLLSQKDLAHDGVIPLRERRWAKANKDTTAGDIERMLRELEVERYVVVDWDLEEVFVRSLVRRDRIYRQPNVLLSAADHLPMVSSRIIRTAMAAELDRIVALDDCTDEARKIIARMRAELPDPDETPAQNPQGNPSGNPSEDPSGGRPGVRGVVTAVTTDSPYPQDPEAPTPTHMSADADDDALLPAPAIEPKPKRPPTDAAKNPDFMRWYEAYPRKEKRPDAYKAWLAATGTKITADELQAKTTAYADACHTAAVEERFIPHPASWLRQERWNERLPTSRASPVNGHQPYRNPADSSIYEGSL